MRGDEGVCAQSAFLVRVASKRKLSRVSAVVVALGVVIGFTTGRTMLTVLACLARHSGSHRRLQFLASILDGFFEFLVL